MLAYVVKRSMSNQGTGDDEFNLEVDPNSNNVIASVKSLTF